MIYQEQAASPFAMGVRIAYAAQSSEYDDFVISSLASI